MEEIKPTVPKEKDGCTRPRSLSASNVEDRGGEFSEEVNSLKVQVTKLEADKMCLEAKVMELVGASKETKEKSDLISAEKKARQHVRQPDNIVLSIAEVLSVFGRWMS